MWFVLFLETEYSNMLPIKFLLKFFFNPSHSLHTLYEAETYTSDTPWRKKLIDDIITYHVTHVYSTDQKQNEDQMPFFKFYDYSWLETLSDVLGWQKNIINDDIMTVTWPGYNLQTRYQWGPDLISQVLQALSPSNVVRYVRLTKEFNLWHHHDFHVIWLQFTDQTQN